MLKAKLDRVPADERLATPLVSRRKHGAPDMQEELSVAERTTSEVAPALARPDGAPHRPRLAGSAASSGSAW